MVRVDLTDSYQKWEIEKNTIVEIMGIYFILEGWGSWRHGHHTYAMIPTQPVIKPEMCTYYNCWLNRGELRFNNNKNWRGAQISYKIIDWNHHVLKSCWHRWNHQRKWAITRVRCSRPGNEGRSRYLKPQSSGGGAKTEGGEGLGKSENINFPTFVGYRMFL